MRKSLISECRLTTKGDKVCKLVCAPIDPAGVDKDGYSLILIRPNCGNSVHIVQDWAIYPGMEKNNKEIQFPAFGRKIDDRSSRDHS